MAKEKKNKFAGSSFESFQKAEVKEMTLEESKAYRAALHKPTPKVLTDEQKREAFRIFWTSNKEKYGKGKSIEKAIWLHLKSIKMDTPEQFAAGLKNFGFKKV